MRNVEAEDGPGSSLDDGGSMRVLIACEYSGRVREAFRAMGDDAWSCDLFEDAEDGSPYHLKGDAAEIAYSGKWDMMVGHPPCTHLAVSGARHFEEKKKDGRQQEAIDFFMTLAKAPIPRIAIENPVCIMSGIWREPDQTIQPWQFGHGETKATCLWLKGLPLLIPTKIVSGREPRVHMMPPGPNRWKERSRTYEGIAQAMAKQWSGYTDLVTMAENEANAV